MELSPPLSPRGSVARQWQQGPLKIASELRGKVDKQGFFVITYDNNGLPDDWKKDAAADEEGSEEFSICSLTTGDAVWPIPDDKYAVSTI
jgi:hypothetical protein